MTEIIYWIETNAFSNLPAWSKFKRGWNDNIQTAVGRRNVKHEGLMMNMKVPEDGGYQDFIC